ncbi:MAG: hypothetical protein ACE5JX_19985, partial [Acidobacteriota bacterium]
MMTNISNQHPFQKDAVVEENSVRNWDGNSNPHPTIPKTDSIASAKSQMQELLGFEAWVIGIYLGSGALEPCWDFSFPSQRF